MWEVLCDAKWSWMCLLQRTSFFVTTSGRFVDPDIIYLFDLTFCFPKGCQEQYKNLRSQLIVFLAGSRPIVFPCVHPWISRPIYRLFLNKMHLLTIANRPGNKSLVKIRHNYSDASEIFNYKMLQIKIFDVMEYSIRGRRCLASWTEWSCVSNVLGLTCITQHESFRAVCLNEDVLWTALASLHDRESAGLPDRQQVPNRYWHIMVVFVAVKF